MDSVALFLSRDYTLSIIQALREAKEKCQGDGRKIMAQKYQDIEKIMWEQHNIAQSIHKNIQENDGEYRIWTTYQSVHSAYTGPLCGLY